MLVVVIKLQMVAILLLPLHHLDYTGPVKHLKVRLPLKAGKDMVVDGMVAGEDKLGV